MAAYNQLLQQSIANQGDPNNRGEGMYYQQNPTGSAVELFGGTTDQGPKAYLVLNESAAISPLMYKDEAYDFAKRIIAGKVPNLAGTVQAFVVMATPVARFKDKAIFENVSVDEVGAPVVNPTQEAAQKSATSNQPGNANE